MIPNRNSMANKIDKFGLVGYIYIYIYIYIWNSGRKLMQMKIDIAWLDYININDSLVVHSNLLTINV